MTTVPTAAPDRARRSYALGAALALLTVVFLLLGMGALGIVGDGDRDAPFLAVPVVLVVGALLARFRAHGMAWALAAAAATTLLACLVAVVQVVRADEAASLVDAVGISTTYAGMFAASGWLFRRSDLLA